MKLLKTLLMYSQVLFRYQFFDPIGAMFEKNNIYLLVASSLFSNPKDKKLIWNELMKVLFSFTPIDLYL